MMVFKSNMMNAFIICEGDLVHKDIMIKIGSVKGAINPTTQADVIKTLLIIYVLSFLSFLSFLSKEAYIMVGSTFPN